MLASFTSEHQESPPERPRVKSRNLCDLQQQSILGLMLIDVSRVAGRRSRRRRGVPTRESKLIDAATILVDGTEPFGTLRTSNSEAFSDSSSSSSPVVSTASTVGGGGAAQPLPAPTWACRKSIASLRSSVHVCAVRKHQGVVDQSCAKPDARAGHWAHMPTKSAVSSLLPMGRERSAYDTPSCAFIFQIRVLI